MGQWGQVPRCTEGPNGGDDWGMTVVDEVDEHLYHLNTNSRCAFRKGVRPDCHHPQHRLRAHGRPDAACVAEYKVAL